MAALGGASLVTYSQFANAWKYVLGKPSIVVSSNGATMSGQESNLGADYGPDTPGTTTCGIQEAYSALPTVTLKEGSTGALIACKIGQIVLTGGYYSISSPIILNAQDYVQFRATGFGGGPSPSKMSYPSEPAVISSSSNKGCLVIQPGPGYGATQYGLGFFRSTGIEYRSSVAITAPIIAGSPYVVQLGSTACNISTVDIPDISVVDDSGLNGGFALQSASLEQLYHVGLLNVVANNTTSAYAVNVNVNHIRIDNSQLNVTGIAAPNTFSVALYLNAIQDASFGTLHFYHSPNSGWYFAQATPVNIDYLNVEVSAPSAFGIAANDWAHNAGPVRVNSYHVNGGWQPFPTYFDTPSLVTFGGLVAAEVGTSAVPFIDGDQTTFDLYPAIAGSSMAYNTSYQNRNPYAVSVSQAWVLSPTSTTAAVASAQISKDGTTWVTVGTAQSPVSGAIGIVITLYMVVPRGWYCRVNVNATTVSTSGNISIQGLG